jgi:peptide deformylase
MAILPIRIYPDPVLQCPAEEVSSVDREVRRLMDEMVETMYDAAGVGLAAPQVGVSRRIIVIDIGGKQGPSDVICLANPTVIKAEEEDEMEAGCLSIPDFSVKLVRAGRVTVEGLDAEGRHRTIEAEGLLARALQHEIDHIRGCLIVDRLTGLTGNLIRRKLRRQLQAASG